MYQKKQPIKTDAEWSQIRFQNSLGPQIGGLLHDACALAVGNKRFWERVKIEDIKCWLDRLYDIAEAKKKELTEIKPVNREAAKKAGDEFKKRYEGDSKAEDINAELNRETEVRENQQRKYGPDNLPNYKEE